MILFSIAFLAFGQQKVTKMERHEANSAWAMASQTAIENAPSIPRGGLVVESEPNGFGKRAWLVYSQSGNYLIQLNTCNGDTIKAGEMSVEIGQPEWIGNAIAFDSAVLGSAMQFFPQVCAVEVIYTNGGKFAKSTISVNPWGGETPRFRFGSEGILDDGRYYIAISPLPEDAVVVLGRSLIASEIRRSPMGSSVVIFPQGFYEPRSGLTTFTVCSEGKCISTTFERKIVPGYVGGKG